MAEPSQPTREGDTPPAAQDARQQVLAAIVLPPLDGLTEAQVRGTACVWHGVHLTPETAVPLGPRTKKWLGETYQWFPSGCKRCVGDRACTAMFLHGRDCPECWRGSDCPFAVAVRQLMREAR